MRLKTAYVRFYKSFNYDYLRKNHTNAKPAPWDDLKGQFFPYVRIPLDPHITTIVGANESGKSHLLTAIEKGVSGTGIEPEDFCRYSQFFVVIQDEIRTPDFGLEWSDLSDAEKKAVRVACGLPAGTSLDQFHLFRTESRTVVYTAKGESYVAHEVEKGALDGILPRTFRIDAEIALPESVSIRELIDGPSANPSCATREQRYTIFESLRGLAAGWLLSPESVQKHAAHIAPALAPVAKALAAKSDEASQRECEKRNKQIGLARDLLLKVARIAPDALVQLETAIRRGSDGHANGIVEQINSALAARLNFPRFWVQDRDFSLVVSSREHDLVFTIRDRTGTQYSFKERSSGLKYFLSYYIQYLAHQAQGPATELLLMDEPDAYLSSQAQQDLLKVFQAYAFPEGKGRPVQVVYVTHSPFLIDKNHADRIRVLEKGAGDEGTRVVRDAARNHYEPLRSAFGAFVGETTFIGNCNLMVEGTSDQIFLAGAATHLRRRGAAETQMLDLNRLTIVPAGSATHIPYLVYLARGRDIERPAVIVLLDSDESGEKARAELERGPRGRPILKPEALFQVGSLREDARVRPAIEGSLFELEDLIPLPLCAQAVRAYAAIFWDDVAATEVESITRAAIAENAIAGQSVWKAIQKLIYTLGEGLHINKTAFARSVIDLLPALGPDDTPSEDISHFEVNMKALFSRLRAAQHTAEKERNSDRVSHKIERLKRGFIQDHPVQATREQAELFLRDLEDGLDDTMESDAARGAIRELRRDYTLTEDILQPVRDFETFLQQLGRVQHAGRLVTQQSPSSALSTSVDLAPKTSARADRPVTPPAT